MSFLTRTTRTFTSRAPLSFTQIRYATLDSSTISQVTDAEKNITGSDEPVKGGPTAEAQKHVGEELDSDNISDITAGEKKITGKDGPIKRGPTAAVQKEVTKERND